MKYPTREPRKIADVYKSTYVDHERVAQDDGRIAVFTWCYADEKPQWVFSRWLDKYGYALLDTDEEQTGELAQTMLTHTVDPSKVCFGIGPCCEVSENEEVRAYKFGGALSMRAGFYIVSKDKPDRVLRYKQTAMS